MYHENLLKKNYVRKGVFNYKTCFCCAVAMFTWLRSSMNFWVSEELKQSNCFVFRHYPKKFYLLRSNINQKLLFDSTISGTRTYRCCRLGLIAIKHTRFRIIIPVKVLWKYSRTHLEESIPPYIKIHIPTLFLFLSRKLYSSLI